MGLGEKIGTTIVSYESKLQFYQGSKIFFFPITFPSLLQSLNPLPHSEDLIGKQRPDQIRRSILLLNGEPSSAVLEHGDVVSTIILQSAPFSPIPTMQG